MVLMFAWVLQYVSTSQLPFIEFVRSRKDFHVIHALGDHEILLNSLKPIFSFHWVLGL
jgi:hypothetical protein